MTWVVGPLVSHVAQVETHSSKLGMYRTIRSSSHKKKRMIKSSVGVYAHYHQATFTTTFESSALLQI